MAGRSEVWSHDGSEVAVMPGYENPFGLFLPLSLFIVF